MGCFNSKEASPGGASSSASRPAPKHHHGGGHMKPKPAAPDAMLAKSFEYIQQLGKGGTGDTGLFKDLQSGEEVAIKLIKRPLPKVIMPNILREVTVSLALLLSLYDLLYPHAVGAAGLEVLHCLALCLAAQARTRAWRNNCLRFADVWQWLQRGLRRR